MTLNFTEKKESELDQLVQTVRIFSQDIGMEFGISKCALLLMKRGEILSEGRNRTAECSRNKSSRGRRDLQVSGGIGSR